MYLANKLKDKLETILLRQTFWVKIPKHCGVFIINNQVYVKENTSLGTVLSWIYEKMFYRAKKELSSILQCFSFSKIDQVNQNLVEKNIKFLR